MRASAHLSYAIELLNLKKRAPSHASAHIKIGEELYEWNEKKTICMSKNEFV